MEKKSFTYWYILKNIIFARSHDSALILPTIFNFIPFNFVIKSGVMPSSLTSQSFWVLFERRWVSYYKFYYSKITRGYVHTWLDDTSSCLLDLFLIVFRFRLYSQAKKEEFSALFWQKHAIYSFALEYSLISSFVELHHL